MSRYRSVALTVAVVWSVMAGVALADARKGREGPSVEPARSWQERAPWRDRKFERYGRDVEIGVLVDGEWLERWRGLAFPADRGGPDVCRQRGQITWSTRRLACPDRLPQQGVRRWSTRPDD
ncbi:hypothetical protein [Billgrantia gudaonensis]|uniref:Uncharacterized protein n=1 Tax=Billgrantia gudaonensis TaxID=376427 RepID=A0A1G8VXY5_9GAMM|nr:hypothetical protein [Halomonas gudaonensis]SDJ70663.1 hypothetical protein SAMN04487954_10782 [Halomonas gudaonensis]